MDERKKLDGIGARVILFLSKGPHNWDVAFREWIDNAFDAEAGRVEIRLNGRCLEVEDNGRGCPDLIAMESIACSGPTATGRFHSSMFGMGGVMSQIRASRDGRVEVESVHRDVSGQIGLDWQEQIRLNQKEIEVLYHRTRPTPPGARTMTLIRIPDCKKFYVPEVVAARLGYAYAGALRRGKRITLVVNGRTYEVKPYEPPPLAKRVDFAFEYQGHAIRGFTAIVAEGASNPHHGWSVHWGYRVAFRATTPAGRHLANRIYGEVHLPEGWDNINPTKDAFADEADGLWDQIAEVSAGLLQEADAQSTDLEIKDALDQASSILTRAITGGGIKGARPGTAGEKGTREPTGRGGKHKQFTTWQEGDDPAELAITLPMRRQPSLIRVSYVGDLEHAFLLEDSGTGRDITLHVSLDRDRPQLWAFRQDPAMLVTLCVGYIAQAMSDRPEMRDQFPSFRNQGYHELHDKLLALVRIVEAEKDREAAG